MVCPGRWGTCMVLTLAYHHVNQHNQKILEKQHNEQRAKNAATKIIIIIWKVIQDI